MSSNLVNEANQQKNELLAARNLKFENLISEISSKLFGITDFDNALNSSLRDMGLLCKAEHAFLVLFNKDKTLMSITHEWCADGVPTHKYIMQRLKIKSFPWLKTQLSNGNIINISDLSHLNSEAKSIKELMEIQTIKSILIAPLYTENEVSGFIGFVDNFKSHKWKYEDQSLLKISSQIIGNALQRHRVEDTLKKSEEKYKLIIENINDLIFIINLNSQFEFINEKGVLDVLGYQKAEIIGKNYITFIRRDGIDQFARFLNETSKGKESKIEVQFQHKGGYWRWFECKGQSFIDNDQKHKWLIISRDITDRKLAEKRYKDLFDKSPNAILLIDFKGFIIDANSTVEKIFKLSKHYFIGKSIEEFNNVFQLDLKSYFKTIFQASFKKDFPKPIEIQIKKGINIDMWIRVQASIIKQESKTLIQLLCEDITEKKKAELLEDQFKEKLEKEVELRTAELNKSFEQQKLYFDQIVKSSQFKTEFMAMMSHELRTPLNAIIGFTDLLLEEVYGDLNEEQIEFINDIKSSAEHQFDMIKHILDISKIESGQMSLNIQKFSLNNLIGQIKSNLKPLYGKKDLKVKIKGLEEEKYIYADPFRFKEILLNLLTNAIKFTIEGKVTLAIREKYNYWLFKVTDTGIGIARKDFPVIFKEFRRVDSTYARSVQGTGLGLPLTKRLVELHGGEISFTSMLGAGSTFTFSISKKFEEKYE